MALRLPYQRQIGLFLIGLYAVVAKKNIIKIIIGLLTIEYATNLSLLLVGFRSRGLAPVLDSTHVEMSEKGDVALSEMYLYFVDPLPQALVLTSIVIGLGVIALAVSMAIRLHQKYNTFDISLIKRLKG